MGISRLSRHYNFGLQHRGDIQYFCHIRSYSCGALLLPLLKLALRLLQVENKTGVTSI